MGDPALGIVSAPYYCRRTTPRSTASSKEASAMMHGNRTQFRGRRDLGYLTATYKALAAQNGTDPDKTLAFSKPTKPTARAARSRSGHAGHRQNVYLRRSKRRRPRQRPTDGREPRK